MVQQTAAVRNGFGGSPPRSESSCGLASLCAVLAPLVLTLAACSVQPVQPPTAPRDAVPVWSQPLLREHLRFFNGSEAEGRGTASHGFERAAAYVAARMKQFRLQPGLHGDYRIAYHMPTNNPLSASLSAGTDTVAYVEGTDFLADARSDSGRVSFGHVMVVPDGAAVPTGGGDATSVVVTTASGATPAFLEEARAQRHRAVLIVGALRPAAATRPVRGLVMLQLTDASAREILGVAADLAVEGGPARGPVALASPLHVRVATEYREEATALNILGYVAGNHPVLRDDMVLVCADLDAVGNTAGVQALDHRNFGISSSAVLEVARIYGLSSQQASGPQRTVLFAVFSGARRNDAGLHAYMQSPLWPLRQTAAVVYVGLDSDREVSIRNLLTRYGIQLIAISPSEEPLFEEELVLLPRSTERRSSDARDHGSAVSASLSRIIEEAVARAHARAQETHDELFRLSAGAEADSYVPASSRLLLLE